MKKGVLKGIAILTTVCTLLTTGQMDTLLAATAEGVSDVVQGIDLASDTEVTQASGTFNLSDWKYTTSGNTLTLNAFVNQNSTDVFIPATTIIEGTTYSVAIASKAFLFQGISNKNKIATITFADGVKFGSQGPMLACDFPYLKSINFGKVDLSSCTSLADMFNNFDASDLNSAVISLSNWDTKNITNMSQMFYMSCEKKIVLTNWNNNSCTNMSEMFANCTASEISLNGFKSPSLTNASYMFRAEKNISSLDISSMNFSKVTNVTGLFKNNPAQTINLGDFQLSSVTDMSEVFYCDNDEGSKLQSLKYTNFSAPKCTDFSKLFYDCSELTSIDLTKFNTSSATTMESMFEGCSKLQLTNLSGLDTAKVTSMESMFKGCSKLQITDLSVLDTGKVTSMESMFQSCSSLKSVDISKIDYSSMLTVEGMFADCKSLSKIVIGEIKTAKVIKNMSGMFSGCVSLKSVDFSKFYNSSVEDLSSLFYMCSALEYANLRGFTNTSKLANVSGMFGYCGDFEELDLSYLDFSGVTKGANITYGTKIKIIHTPYKTSSAQIKTLSSYSATRVYEYVNGKLVGGGTFSYWPTNQTSSRTFVYSRDGKHVWSDFETIEAKTCYSPEKKGYKCLLCGDINWTSVGTDYLSHDETATVTQKAGIGTNGIITYTCKNYEYCKDSRTVEFAGVGALILDTSEYAYDGNPKTPGVKVIDTDGNVISSDNYTVEYLNNTEVGTATAKVTMTGNYTGSLEANFTITKTASASKSGETASGSDSTTSETYAAASTSIKKLTAKITSKKAKHKAIKLSWKKLSGISGYQIQASTSKKFSKKTTTTVKIEGANKTSTTIKKLKAKKKYYVRIRAYKNVEKDGSATQVYTSWSKKTSVKTKK